MKKLILILVHLTIAYLLRAQPAPQPIVLGRVDTIFSNILKENRPIWVYTPGYDTTYFSKPEFPVLYVLDADDHFMSLVTMVKELSATAGNTVFPQMIIVGILNTRGHRTRDLTPTKSAMDKSSGGGENFAAFMQTELIPYIDQHYPTAPYRTLIGHSLGGLTVINMQLKHTQAFSAYIAIDPSMFYDNENLLKQTPALLKQKDFKGRKLFLGFANTMNEGMDTAEVRKDTAEISHHIRAIMKLSDYLTANKNNNLLWAKKYYPDDDHNSVPLNAEYDALRFIFKNNRFPRNQPYNQYFDKQYSATQLRQMIEAHYKALSAEMGYNVRASEPEMNGIGYAFLQQKDYEKAAMFFQVNIDNYPKNFNVYDSMGDCYLAQGDKANAEKLFKKALSIKYTKEILDKLDQLQAAK
ncbi:alpha/beta hydrolase-fold protein [Mucilaginibacter sp. CAU 1740]|uniref:alpha/beta hydrolase-fold protein n=1 Tax=Mucilaginibacter sp. CAU 1740 TaxID=3140365 RepID=UPI00325ABBB7